MRENILYFIDPNSRSRDQVGGSIDPKHKYRRSKKKKPKTQPSQGGKNKNNYQYNISPLTHILFNI
jgi:hypothetical protein